MPTPKNIILNHVSDTKTVYRTTIHRHPFAAALGPVDLRPGFVPVFDQGQYGSCGPNAMVGAMMYDEAAQGTPVQMLSRFFLYLNTRIIEGDIADDTGVSNEDLVQAAAQSGVCLESDFPYDDAHFAATPTPANYATALSYGLLVATPLTQDLDTVMTTLSSRTPIVAGISVYSSFMSDTTASSGIITVPDLTSETLEGDHDIVIAGADPVQDFAWLRNSWGASWGLNGYAKIPLRDYLLNPKLADSLWAVKRVGAILVARAA